MRLPFRHAGDINYQLLTTSIEDAPRYCDSNRGVNANETANTPAAETVANTQHRRYSYQKVRAGRKQPFAAFGSATGDTSRDSPPKMLQDLPATPVGGLLRDAPQRGAAPPLVGRGLDTRPSWPSVRTASLHDCRHHFIGRCVMSRGRTPQNHLISNRRVITSTQYGIRLPSATRWLEAGHVKGNA